jgi:hypothetical protein
MKPDIQSIPTNLPEMNGPARYEIQVRGELDSTWIEWFDPLEFYQTCQEGETVLVLTGMLPDQAALQGTLKKLYLLGLPILVVKVV